LFFSFAILIAAQKYQKIKCKFVKLHHSKADFKHFQGLLVIKLKFKPWH